MKTFYAVVKTKEYMDLWFFEDKKSRDEWIKDDADKYAVTLEEIKQNNHLNEQLNFKKRIK